MRQTRGSQYLWAPSALSEEKETRYEENTSFPPSSIYRYLKYCSEVQKLYSKFALIFAIPS